MLAAAELPKRGSKHDLAGGGRFNAEAAIWDNNPGLHALLAEANKAIVKKIPEMADSSGSLNVLEIGCGTGLLTLLMAPRVNSIIVVDAALRMIQALEQKLTKPSAPTNVVPVCDLLEGPEDPALPLANPSDPSRARQKYDVITSHLVLHHIPNLRGVLNVIFGCLKKGGYIALTDFENFDAKAHKFHSKARM